MQTKLRLVEADPASLAKRSTALERALRFNRGVIGLCLVALAVMIFLPI